MNSTTSLATQLRKSIDDSVNRLAAAVNRQRGSEEVKRYLDVMARFPMYSWRNACLISLQRPQASLVAGFSHWNGYLLQSQLQSNRLVERGHEPLLWTGDISQHLQLRIINVILRMPILEG